MFISSFSYLDNIRNRILFKNKLCLCKLTTAVVIPVWDCIKWWCWIPTPLVWWRPATTQHKPNTPATL